MRNSSSYHRCLTVLGLALALSVSAAQAVDDERPVENAGKAVLSRCWYIHTGWKSQANYHYRFSKIPWGFAKGDAITVEAGKTYPMEVIIGEQPGGESFTTLLQEVDGVSYEKDRVKNPILPVFRMSSAKPASDSPGRPYPPHLDDGPVWRSKPAELGRQCFPFQPLRAWPDA